MLLRLTARGDPNGEVFSCYSRCLAQLADAPSLARTLRIFELDLLRALGYGLELDGDSATGEPLRDDSQLRLRARAGASPCRGRGRPTRIATPGRELMSLRDGKLDDEASLRTAQRLLGRVLRAHLGERPLQSRLVLQDIVSRGL